MSFEPTEEDIQEAAIIIASCMPEYGDEAMTQEILDTIDEIESEGRG